MDMYDLLENAGIIVTVILTIALVLTIIIVPIAFISYHSNKAVCATMSKSLETDFGFWQGCMVKDPKSGIWMSSDNIEQINGTLNIKEAK